MRPKPRILYFKKLVELSKSEENPDALLLEIANSKSGFAELLDTEIKPDWLVYILKILSIVIKSSEQSKTLITVLLQVERNFLSKLITCLGEISVRTASFSRLWSNKETMRRICQMIIQILRTQVQTLHSSLGQCKIILMNVKHIIVDSNLDLENEDLLTELESVEDIFQIVVSKRDTAVHEKQIKKQRKHAHWQEEGLPPEDFRELSILPNTKDLQLDERPFLRANKSKGKYENLDTYLDIQFRLLREDFMQPLRTGISEYIQSLSEKNATNKIREIRLYKNVQIVRPVCSSEGIHYIIQFDSSAFKRINWTTSRRLIYGSLLCLSSDNFQTVWYATVKDRNPSDLNEGYVRVHFETMPSTNQSETFLMAETTSYFEAFRHILEGLQLVNASLPFQRYIIECNTVIKPPSYLLSAGVPVYDFTCILPPPQAKKSSFTSVPVLNTVRWPKDTDLGLDPSQYEAVKLALTKELAIIQGPPGTGKTFIGLKIAQLLLANKDCWKCKDSSDVRPILVVCYTNHALDQFLEGILRFCKDGIIRIGGRCKNETLTPFILRNVKREMSKTRRRTWGILQNERDCLREISSCQRTIHAISSEMKKTFTDIIPYTNLKELMTYEQQHSFECKMSGEEEKFFMRIWLELQSSSDDVDDTTNLLSTEEMNAYHIWQTHILENVEEMPSSEKTLIGDPSRLGLHDRARLYKSWLSEYRQVLSDTKSFLNRRHPNKLHDMQELDSLLRKSNTEITHPFVMLKYVQSQSMVSEIKLLKPNEFQNWLAIDGSTNSMLEIKNTLMEDVKENENDNEMDEERELDSDDEEFLFDYSADDVRRNDKFDRKPKQKGEWILKWNAKKGREKVNYIFNNAEKLSDIDAESIEYIGSVSVEKRRSLYRYWILKYRNKLKEKVYASEKTFNDLTERLKEVRDAETVEVLKKAQVIGMTTTGAAKHRKSLQIAQPAIVIVEEAAEVLESHIITALSKDCKHLILIGDHKQLRPSTTVYELAQRYQLDISLFERMIKNDVPCVTLSEQHRMRPEISVLLKNKYLYPDLKDHSKVFNYNSVQGIESDIFFINHSKEESRIKDSTSYQNQHEARFISGLCKYLLKQGYMPDQITVLSPYMGQVTALRKEMPKADFEGVRITPVDNYQGEENDVILLSLVRSSAGDEFFSKRNRIGFLGIENRICVALSRAKMGFYVVGNFTLLKSQSNLWNHIVCKMTESNHIGEYLTLRCQNHPQNRIKAMDLDDFQKAPEGGCTEPCGGRLKCNHLCPRVCHIIDKDHERVRCLKPCSKIILACGHRCLKKCSEDCGKCNTFTEKKIPMCGHTFKMPCHKDPYTWKCTKNCEFQLPCGHSCNRNCNECVTRHLHEDKCRANVLRNLSCGHNTKLMCFEDPNIFLCPEPCRTKLSCGHICSGSCGTCLGGKIHKSCQKTCGKELVCGHKCSYRCSDLCPPCNLPCEWVCSHGTKCKKSCSEECDKCEEECKYQCRHKKCTKLCHEKCENIACDERCNKVLSCGHPCIGLCGEACMCSEFCSDDKNKYRTLYDKDTVYVKLRNCNCIVPQHILDTYMSQTARTRGGISKRCPDCKKLIASLNKRYSDILKQTRCDIVSSFNVKKGSEKEMKQRMRILSLDIDSLTLIGLDRTDKQFLDDRLNDGKFGTLHVIGKAVELLTKLLKACKKLKSLPLDKKLVIEPSKIKEIIMRKRNHGSTQLWNEIEAEIKRIDYIVKLTTIRQNSGSDFGASVRQKIYMKTIELLAEDKPLDLKRVDVCDKVIAQLQA